MIGYTDPNAIVWEAEYWDEYLKEFGPAAYVEARYLGGRQCGSTNTTA